MKDLPRVIGRYTVVRELGRGGMGVVYEVRHPEIPRPLALKQVLASAVTPEALLRFAREGQLLARVSHRGVVRVHQLDHAPQGPFLVTDLVEGRPLAELARDGRLAPREAARLVREVADAVAALHAAGVLHRDLKGSNVLVQRDGQPVLVDFGLGRDVAGADRLTATGDVMGTPTHMAPEQVAGETVGPAADVWGLGALLHEALTGRPPFAGPTVIDTLRRVLEEAPPPPSSVRPGVGRALDDLVRLALAKDPAERPPSAAALRDALDAVLRGEDGQGRRRRGARLLGAALLLAAALGFAAALGLGPARPGLAPPAAVTSPARSDAPPPAPRAGVVASIVSRIRGPIPCLVETLPRSTRGAFTGDHLVTWSPGERELRVWTPDGAGALEGRALPVDEAIVTVAVDPDLPDGERPVVAVVTKGRLLLVSLLEGERPVEVARGTHERAALLLAPPRVVVGDRTDRLSLRGASDGATTLLPAPAPAAVQALVAGSGTVAVIDAQDRVFVWKDHRNAESIIAPVPGRSVAVAHGRVLVGSPGGTYFLAARDMTPLGEIHVGVDAPVDSVALAHGATALLVGPWLAFGGEGGPPWTKVARPPDADQVALDPTGRVALVATPKGVQVWALQHSLTPFGAATRAGLAPAGRLPRLDVHEGPPPAPPPEVAWLSSDRVVVATPTGDDVRRLRVWHLVGGQARPALAVDAPRGALAVVGSRLLLEEKGSPLLPSVHAPDLDRALLVAPEPGGEALVGLTRNRLLRRAPASLLRAGQAERALGALPAGAEPAALAVARGGRVALASYRREQLVGQEGIVDLWDPGGPRPRPPDRKVRFPAGGRPVVAFSPDGRRLAIGYGSGALLVLDAATDAGAPHPAWALADAGASPHSITGLCYGHEGRVVGVAFLAEDDLVSLSTRPAHPAGPDPLAPATAFDHELRRWRLGPAGWSPAGPPARWSDGALRVNLAASPDGRRLAVPAADGRVDLFAVDPLP